MEKHARLVCDGDFAMLRGNAENALRKYSAAVQLIMKSDSRDRDNICLMRAMGSASNTLATLGRSTDAYEGIRLLCLLFLRENDAVNVGNAILLMSALGEDSADVRSFANSFISYVRTQI